MTAFSLTNARIVLEDNVMTGSLTVEDGRITDIRDSAAHHKDAIDFEGDYLIPGLIDVHTDNLEKHMEPRPGVDWPALPGLFSHDAQMIAGGITTVLNALSIGSFHGSKPGRRHTLLRAATLLADDKNRRDLRAEHLLHLRCEVSSPDVVDALEEYIGNPLIKMISVMDHTPGQRQWRNVDKWRQFHSKDGLSEQQMLERLDAMKENQDLHANPNRVEVVKRCHHLGVTLASHDDTTLEHIAEAQAEGIRVSEFPCTLDAAKAARDAGMLTVMGGPNVVMGGSHSGNVSALELVEHDLLDGLASDYVPSSMLNAAFHLPERADITLPQAIRTVTSGPADMLNMADRGRIQEGLRADLLRVHTTNDAPVVVTVWREGKRVH